MKRASVHCSGHDLDNCIELYTPMFAGAPDKRRADYAKWRLDDPSANISISTRAGGDGIHHLGAPVGDDAALAEIAERLSQVRRGPKKRSLPRTDRMASFVLGRAP